MVTVEWEKKLYSVKEAAKATGCTEHAIRGRITLGWSPHRIMTTPRIVTIKWRKRLYSVNEAAKRAGCTRQAIRCRIARKWTPNRIMTTPQIDPAMSGKKGGSVKNYKRKAR